MRSGNQKVGSLSPRSSFINNNNDDQVNGQNGLSENARVKVVIRIRPLSQKEKEKGHKVIVQGLGSLQQIIVWDPSCFEAASRPATMGLDPACWSREFCFDRCLWSVDPNTDTYVNQDGVFDEIGTPILNWVLGGYNCCVFAFGQTGAGKSYTMMGDLRSDPSKYGLIPRICHGLFESQEAKAAQAEGTEMIVTFSHMEIYNENVRDLLANPSSGFLRVREHPRQGVFVSNLTTISVTKFEDIMSLISVGDKNRTVASTQLNAHSSRSHAIVTLTVIQRSRNAPKNGLPTSALQQRTGRVHLVDLAGSERVTFSGAKGDRLREANNINRSLSVLGDVIKCLGDSRFRSQKVHVPYRNSTLTMVLKDSLGGNAHAIMIANISPGSYDYEETISTLKYADRAKRVRMRVDANVTSGLLATDATAVELVPLLQAEVNKLRELLKQQQQQQELQHQELLNASSDFVESSEVVQEMRERVRELEKQLEEREKLIDSLDLLKYQNDINSNSQDSEEASNIFESYSQLRMSLSDSISASANSKFSKTAKKQVRHHPVVLLSEDTTIDVNLPRIINLNQDPLFSECLLYYVPNKMLAGSIEADSDILLSGPDITAKHCALYYNNGDVLIEAFEGALVFVNGEILLPGTKSDKSHYRLLNHYDRIAFGRFHLFRFEAVGKNSRTDTSVLKPDWEFAQEELMSKNYSLMGSLQKPSPTKPDTSPAVSNKIKNNVSNNSNGKTGTQKPSPVLPKKVDTMEIKYSKQNYDESYNEEISPISVSVQSTPPSPPPYISSISTPIDENVEFISIVDNIKNTPVTKIKNENLPSIEKLRANNSISSATTKIPTMTRNSPPPPPPSDMQLSSSTKQNTSLGSSAAVASAIKRANGNDSSVNDLNNNNKAKDDWWDRVNRVAEGKEQAKPADIRMMLKSVVESAEERLYKKTNEDHIYSPQSSIDAKANVNKAASRRHSISNYEYPNQQLTSTAQPSSAGASKDNVPQRRHSTNENGGQSSAAVFEKEAQALQEELEQMQKTLQERMKRYQALSSTSES